LPSWKLVGDHPQVIHAGVLDGDRQRRVGEIGDLKLARPASAVIIGGVAGETRDLQLVRFAEVLGEIPSSPPAWRPSSRLGPRRNRRIFTASAAWANGRRRARLRPAGLRAEWRVASPILARRMNPPSRIANFGVCISLRDRICPREMLFGWQERGGCG